MRLFSTIKVPHAEHTYHRLYLRYAGVDGFSAPGHPSGGITSIDRLRGQVDRQEVPSGERAYGDAVSVLLLLF